MNDGRAIDQGAIEGAMDDACDHPLFLRLTGIIETLFVLV